MKNIYDKNIKDNIIIYEGKLDGFRWYIKSIEGSHPCAYVEVDKNNKHYKEDLENCLTDVVHGGITYCKMSYNEKRDGMVWVFGWDYAHSGDFTSKTLAQFVGFSQDWGGSGGKKWSKDEIMKDIISFVVWLKSEEM